MTSTKIAITIPSWVAKEVIGNPANKSSRITELLIKGHMYENQSELQEALTVKNAVRRIHTRVWLFISRREQELFNFLSGRTYKALSAVE